MQSFDLQFTEAAKKIAVEKNYSCIADASKPDTLVIWASPSVVFENMTNDLCETLGIK